MSLKIHLAEPVVILPAFDTPEFDRATLTPTAFAVRGLLSLTLHKPTWITSIDTDLSCRSTTAWPSGTMHDGKVLPDVEQHVLFSTEERFFPTDQSRGRSAFRDPGTPPSPSSPQGSESNSPAPPVRPSLPSRGSSASKSRPHTPIERIGRLFGLEPSSAHDGTLFEAGTYNYPIFLEVPLHLPQTVRPLLHPATITWLVSARAGRAGKKKLSEVQEVNVVRSSPESEVELIQNVERAWEEQLHYRLTVPLHEQRGDTGGSLPFELMLTPVEKVKILKVSVSVEEETAFYTKNRQLVRRGVPKMFTLLNLENPDRLTPILPILTESVDSFRKSPLASLIGPGEDPQASSLMGAGPWLIQKTIKLSGMSFTHRHEASTVDIKHTLRVVIRVQRSDRPALYDLEIKLPFHLVSDFALERTRLPEYSEEPIELTEAIRARWLGFTGTEAQQLERHRRFERLISGREDIMGDPPPAYEGQQELAPPDDFANGIDGS